MSRHRLQRTRPRYGRIAAAGTSVVVVFVAVLGAAGAVPPLSTDANEGDQRSSAADTKQDDNSDARTGTRPQVLADPGQPVEDEAADDTNQTARRPVLRHSTTLPARSGQGRRVVFSEVAQRVWLVTGGNEVARTYLVSGSAYDNLDPGTYSVFSRSERAWGVDDSGTMRWFVRFAEGPNAAIGFHSIPLLGGSPVQTIAQLGIPLSHGCIRQKTADARALWEFAPIGTTVVVV